MEKAKKVNPINLMVRDCAGSSMHADSELNVKKIFTWKGSPQMKVGHFQMKFVQC